MDYIVAAKIIASTVAECPTGAPSGLLYAGMMAHIDLAGYQSCIDALRKAGLVEVRGDAIYPTPKLAGAA